jgi:hypothetical protein
MKPTETHVKAIKRIIEITGFGQYFLQVAIIPFKKTVQIVVLIPDEAYRNSWWYINQKWLTLFKKFVSKDIFVEITVNSSEKSFETICNYFYYEDISSCLNILLVSQNEKKTN